jgi:hypothetical protein
MKIPLTKMMNIQLIYPCLGKVGQSIHHFGHKTPFIFQVNSLNSIYLNFLPIQRPCRRTPLADRIRYYRRSEIFYPNYTKVMFVSFILFLCNAQLHFDPYLSKLRLE